VRLQEEALPDDFPDFARRQNPDYDKQVAADKGIGKRREGPQWPARENAPKP